MEKAVEFTNEGRKLRGILHLPEARDPAGTGVVFLHGWSGCRHGPHLMFVKAARRFSDLGNACLRFDFRGRGESEGETIEAGIGSMISDTRAAMDCLHDAAPVRRVVLLGICSGCKVAIGAAAADSRPSGLALWSAEPMGEMKDASVNARKTAHALRQYARKALQPRAWLKILSFRVNTGLVRKAVLEHETATVEERRRESLMLKRFRETFRGRVLFIYGSNDPETRLASRNYSRLCGRAAIPNEVHEILGANHSYYSLVWEKKALDLTERWLMDERHRKGGPK
jgi:hypothetical protein